MVCQNSWPGTCVYLCTDRSIIIYIDMDIILYTYICINGYYIIFRLFLEHNNNVCTMYNILYVCV